MGTGVILASIAAEYRRHKALADSAMAQLAERELGEPGPGSSSSVAVVAWHVAGNLTSRFTDFLETDGEKPWRNREEEFSPRQPAREELMRHWEDGWRVLFESLSSLTDENLYRTVRIRGTELAVHEALHRSLAHTSYHVGQMVYLAKALRGPSWKYLSIPPGGTDAYNKNPTSERAESHTTSLSGGNPMPAGFPVDGVELSLLLVVGDLEQSKKFYRDVLGAEFYREYGGTSCVFKFQGSWLLLVTGGGPTDDKPGVTFVAPEDPERVSSQITLRVPDCHAAYNTLVERGAGFLTPPKDRGSEVRCFFRDPDGHLLEISEAK